MFTATTFALVLLGALLLFLGFLLLGALRTVSLLAWRLDQLEATTPGRLNRNGLPPGELAPDFTLPDLTGRVLTLSGHSDRDTLLVFVQSRCGPCHAIVPELNRLQRRRDLQVLAVLHADSDEAQEWAAETRPEFPVAVQEDWSVSKQYEVFATPFAFLIDRQGVIRSKGILSRRQHVGLLLSTAERPPSRGPGNASDDLAAGAHLPALQTS